MPPPPIRRKGKEAKETVIYPSSKRPAPPFKPLRPSKVPRTDSNTSIGASRPPAPKPTAARRTSASKANTSRSKDPEEHNSSKTISSDHEVDDELEEVARKPIAARRRPSNAAQRGISPVLISSHEAPQSRPDADDDPLPSQSDPTPSIPQALLLRLLHEGFTDKNTKIDKHAIQVLQKYMEIFVREAIARAKHGKLEAAVEGDESELGGTWLDLEDLERVAPGLLCDF